MMKLQETKFCPECQENGLKSRVKYVGSSRTLMAWNPYWDENGVLNNKDPNTSTHSYACDMGHYWTEKTN